MRPDDVQRCNGAANVEKLLSIGEPQRIIRPCDCTGDMGGGYGKSATTGTVPR